MRASSGVINRFEDAVVNIIASIDSMDHRIAFANLRRDVSDHDQIWRNSRRRPAQFRSISLQDNDGVLIDHQGSMYESISGRIIYRVNQSGKRITGICTKKGRLSAPLFVRLSRSTADSDIDYPVAGPLLQTVDVQRDVIAGLELPEDALKIRNALDRATRLRIQNLEDHVLITEQLVV